MITEDDWGFKQMNFRENRKYEVNVIDDAVHIIGEYNTKVFNYDTTDKNEKKFEKYFYTLKQLRKIKLEQIDEV